MRRNHYQQGTIPAGYTLLNYLESNGNPSGSTGQYINTGIDTYKLETEIKFKECQVSQPTYKLQLVGGCWNANNNRYYISSHIHDRDDASASNYLCSVTKSNTPIRLQLTDLTKINVVIYNNDYNQIICNGEVKGTIPDITAQGLTNKILLFAGVEGNGAITRSSWRIYYVKFRRKDINKLVGYFVPVQDSQGVPCMYDYVSKNTFYNQGTGTFLYA